MNSVLRLVWVWGGGAAAVFTGIAAFIRGGAPERWGAVILLTAWFIPGLLDSGHGFRYALFAGDAAAMLAYLIVALRWRRLWAFASTASQFLAVMTHVIVWYTLGVRTWAYITLAAIFGGDLPMIFLAIGVLTASRPRRD